MPPAHILVAEDQTDIRDLLVMNLRNAGYEVSAVGDGEAALGLIRLRINTTFFARPEEPQTLIPIT